MDTLRVFFSFHVPPALAAQILADLPADLPCTPSPQANVHCTLKFIGNVTQPDIDQMAAAVAPLTARTAPIRIAPTEFRIVDERLRLMVDPDYPLMMFQTEFTEALRRFSFVQLERHNYAPHITLGRVQAPFDPAAIPTTNISSYAFVAQEFGLYQSVQGESKLGEYTLLKSFALEGK